VRALATPLLLVVALAAAGCGGDDDGPPALAIAHPPVVVVVFDEFPADTLLRPDGRIDAERFPNFAALARISTWFPNAYTVYDSTFASVPSILDARLPRPRTAADVRSHQPSVFHLMNRLGYDIVKVESATAVCPPRICTGARARRPGVLARLAGGGRPPRLHRWIGAIRHRPHPTFYFHHALLPHEPWIYLPSGHRDRPTGKDPIGGINRWVGFHDPDLSEHNHMRHLLQVGYTDHQLGLLLQRLRRTGLLEESLIVVTADHGYSFNVGALSRRKVSDRNIEEIAPVPFFVKAPGQMEGAVNRSLARTVDIVPTVADLLGVPVRWPHDGYSAFSAVTRRRSELRISTRSFDRVITIGRKELVQRRRAVRLARARTFGTGVQSRLLFGDPWATVYRVGPHRGLLDRRVAGLRVAGSAGLRATVANAGLVRHVTPGAELLPTRVTGTLGRGRPGVLRDLAVAVNGRIRAVGRSFRLRFRPDEYFSFVVPEDSLRPGRNSVEVFQVKPGGALAPLARVG
jgi:hypothetical protein